MTQHYDNLQCPYTGKIETRDGVGYSQGMPGCGCPIGMTAISARNLWEGCRDELDYYFDASAAPSTTDMPYDSDYEEAYAEACQMWERKIGVRFRQVALSDRPNFKVGFRWIGRSVLGISNVGGSCSSVGGQDYGTQWNWVKPRFRSTAAHEIGHILGLGHDVCMYDGSPVLMCWQIQTDFDEIDDRTTGFLLPEYGGPIVDQEPPIPPPPTGDYATRDELVMLRSELTESLMAMDRLLKSEYLTTEQIKVMIKDAGGGLTLNEVINKLEAHRDGAWGRDIISTLRLKKT